MAERTKYGKSSGGAIMKDLNELEKLEQLSKSLSEESVVQKPKSKMPFIIIGAVVLVAIIVGAVLINNNKAKQEESKPDTIYEDNVAVEEEPTDNSDSEEAKEQKPAEPAKKMKVGDTVKAETEYGSFEVKVVSAAHTDWYDESEDSEAVVVRLEVNNIDYVGEWDEGYFNGYTLDDTGSLTVLDKDGFKVGYYDIAGPTDGQYEVSSDIHPSEKARVSYPYIVPKGTKELVVNVNQQYEIPVEISDEVVHN